MITQKADQEPSALRAQSQFVIGVAVSGHLLVAACGQIAMTANIPIADTLTCNATALPG